MGLNFSTKETTFNGKQIFGAVLELDNAVIALFWEGTNPRLGTLTITLPNKAQSTLLGERDRFFGQLIGEKLASVYRKMALVSTNLSFSTRAGASGVGRALMDLVKSMTGEVK